MEYFLSWLFNLDMFWLINLPFSLGCMPMMYKLYQLDRLTGARDRGESTKITLYCFIPLLNIAMFFKSYIDPEERYWQSTCLAIVLINDMDKRLEKAISEEKDVMAKLLYGVPLMRYELPWEKLKKLRHIHLQYRVIDHLIAHCNLQGHTARLCEDGKEIFLQVHLGGANSADN